jgi:hypothetical protein
VSECTHLANKAVELLRQGSPCSSIAPVLLRFLKAFPVCLKAYLRRPGSRALNEQIQGCADTRVCRYKGVQIQGCVQVARVCELHMC